MKERGIFWLILIPWAGIIFCTLYFTKIITPFTHLSETLSIVEQAFYALVLAPYPAFLAFMTIKRTNVALSFQRLLLESGSLAALIFVLQIMLFILFEASLKIKLPEGSNLFNSDLAHQIAAYSRIPMLSQFVAIFLFLGAYVSKSVKPGDDPGKPILVGLLFYIPYLVGFYLTHLAWNGYFTKLLVPPNRINLFLVFIHWLPTIYFLALTYIYSVKQKK
jgi:hypothetical protein